MGLDAGGGGGGGGIPAELKENIQAAVKSYQCLTKCLDPLLKKKHSYSDLEMLFYK